MSDDSRQSPGGKRGAATPSFSTSVGRANFARALETTDREKTVVGFDRYNKPVAALVPIEAVSMLAGQDSDIDPQVRAKIMRMARIFLVGMTMRVEPAEAAAPRAKKKAAPKKAAKRAPKKKTKARAKVAGRR